MCLFGSICFSSKAILVKLAYRDTQVDAVSLLALRMIFSLPVFFSSAWFISKKGNNIKFTIKQWAKIAFIGCLGYYISSLLDFIGLQFISASTERLILFIYPTLVVVMSSIVYKERITKYQWIAIIISYTGLAIAFSGEVSVHQVSTNQFYIGAILIFACAFTYAAYIVGSGRLIPKVGAAKFNSYAMGFAAVGVITHFYVSSNRSLLHLETNVYAYSFLMAIIATVIPSYLISEAIKRIGSNNSAIVSSIGPVSTILQAYFFLGEPISVLQFVGTLFILAGVLLISVKRKPTSTSI